MLKNVVKGKKFSHPFTQTKSPAQVIDDSAVKANGATNFIDAARNSPI